MHVSYDIRTEQYKDDEGNISEITVIGVYDKYAGTRETYYAHEQDVLIEDIGASLANALAEKAGW